MTPEDMKRLCFDLPVEETDRSVLGMHNRHNALLGEKRSHLRVQAPLQFLSNIQQQGMASSQTLQSLHHL